MPAPNRALGLTVLLLVVLAFPYGMTAQRKRPVSPAASLDVPPSPEVDARVADEVAKAKTILADLNVANVLASPYLVSAVYYHDGFLDDFPADRSTASPERRIIGQIGNALTGEIRVRFVRLLHETCARTAPALRQQYRPPVAYRVMSGRRSHNFAVDLFAPEGAPVVAVSRGLVVLADRDWSKENLFSTTSRKGGNAVILFDPDQNRFYRYCHLSAVKISIGDVVAAGTELGQVGHTGLNASRDGHGRHLHFEANEWAGGKVRSIDYVRLRTMLRSWSRSQR